MARSRRRPLIVLVARAGRTSAAIAQWGRHTPFDSMVLEKKRGAGSPKEALRPPSPHGGPPPPEGVGGHTKSEDGHIAGPKPRRHDQAAAHSGRERGTGTVSLRTEQFLKHREKVMVVSEVPTEDGKNTQQDDAGVDGERRKALEGNEAR